MRASEMHRNEYIKERKRKEVITSIFFVCIIVLFFLLGYFALSKGNDSVILDLEDDPYLENPVEDIVPELSVFPDISF